MEDVEKQVKRLEWSPALQRRLGESLANDAVEIAIDIQSGQLVVLEWGGELLTVVEIVDHTEMVFCCVAGKNVGRWLSTLKSFAKACGCSIVRFHSSRAGLKRLLSGINFVDAGFDSSGLVIYKAGI